MGRRSRNRNVLEDIGALLRQYIGILILLIVVGIGAFALFVQDSPNPEPVIVQQTIDVASTQSNLNIPTIAANMTQTPIQAALTAAAPTISLEGRQEVQQYAASAWATTEGAELEQSALQATGPPNTEGCKNAPSAYASASPGEQAVLTLFYPQLVTPTGILIHQSFSPGYISQIVITDNYGEVHTVYEATPQPFDLCPFTLPVPIIDADYQANIVTIYIDQLGAGWNQIDAVQLVGIRYN